MGTFNWQLSLLYLLSIANSFAMQHPPQGLGLLKPELRESFDNLRSLVPQLEVLLPRNNEEELSPRSRDRMLFGSAPRTPRSFSSSVSDSKLVPQEVLKKKFEIDLGEIFAKRCVPESLMAETPRTTARISLIALIKEYTQRNNKLSLEESECFGITLTHIKAAVKVMQTSPREGQLDDLLQLISELEAIIVQNIRITYGVPAESDKILLEIRAARTALAPLAKQLEKSSQQQDVPTLPWKKQKKHMSYKDYKPTLPSRFASVVTKSVGPEPSDQ